MLRRALPEVLAGQANLGRPVRWVHIVDVPDPTELLRGGELVLSTGLGPGHDEDRSAQFRAQPGAQGAAGLLIEIGYSYRNAVPDELVADASERACR